VKRSLGTLTLVGLVFVAPLHAEAGAASCRVPGGHAIVTGKVARLIAVPTPRGSALLACIRRGGRKIALDDSYTDARLAGRWAAWQRAGRPGHWRIAVQDLRTAKSRLVDGHVAAHSLGLTAAGTVVWAQEQDSGDATPLYANEVGRSGRLLDGGAVDAKSVRLAGRRVSWLSGGQPRAAIVR
jgi:hypothetical protein